MHSLATSTLAWVGFCVFILIMLAIDLGLFIATSRNQLRECGGLERRLGGAGPPVVRGIAGLGLWVGSCLALPAREALQFVADI